MSKKVRELKSRRAALVTQITDLTNGAEAAGRDLSDTEMESFGDLKAKIEGLDKQIEAAEYADKAAASIGVEVPGSRIEVSDNREADPTRGFHSFGEFASSVARMATLHGHQDQRLAAAPGTFGNESTGTDGGFSIPPQFSQELWRLSLGEESLIPLTENSEIGGNSMIFPKDESTPWGGSGIQAYWQAEAKQAEQSKPVIGTNTMVLHKMMCMVPVTNEQIDDGFAIGSYLSQVAPERITWKANESILFGDGIGKPQGALNSPAVVIQAKDPGQTANTLSSANISNMVSRLLVGQLKNSVWIANPDILTPLESLTVGSYPIYLPNMTAANAPYGMLKGRPLILSEHANAFGSQGDINLISLKGYRTITKAGGIQTATSMHLFFDADSMAFRFTFRLNGQPILSKPVAPPKSPNARSHFITLAAR